MTPCELGNGEDTGWGPGVPLLELTFSLMKLSGISFQLVMFLAAEGGGTEGDDVLARGGGGSGVCWGGW